jgi:UDP-glucose 4-epimerase
VTGAAGFVGSKPVDRLLGDGEVVVGYDNLSTGMPEFIGSMTQHRYFYPGDDTANAKKAPGSSSIKRSAGVAM